VPFADDVAGLLAGREFDLVVMEFGWSVHVILSFLV